MHHPYVLFGTNTCKDRMSLVQRGGKPPRSDLKSTSIGDNGANIMVTIEKLFTPSVHHPYVLFGTYTCKDRMCLVQRGGKPPYADLKSTTIGENGANIMVIIVKLAKPVCYEVPLPGSAS